MSRKPSEVYAINDWDFLAQPKVEGQWFERKAHPPSQSPKGELHFEDEPATLCSDQDLEPGIVTEFIERYAQQKRFRDIPDVGLALRLARLTTQRDGQPWLTKSARTG